MAERGRGSDETVAAQNAGMTAVGKTTGMPNRTPTEAVELAWSEGDDANFDGGDGQDDRRPTSAPASQSWGATLQRAGAMLGICLVVAGAIVFAHWLLSSPKSPTKTAEPSSAAPATSGEAAAPTAGLTKGAPTSAVTKDDKYIQDLRARGIKVANPENAIANGQTVCKRLDEGQTREWVVQFVKDNLTEFAEQASDFVTVAIQYYCPKYG